MLFMCYAFGFGLLAFCLLIQVLALSGILRVFRASLQTDMFSCYAFGFRLLACCLLLFLISRIGSELCQLTIASFAQ